MLKVKEWLRKKYAPEPLKAEPSEGEYSFSTKFTDKIFQNLVVSINDRGEKIVTYRPIVSLENVEIKIS